VIVVDEDSWEHGGSDDVNPARWHRTNTLFGSSAVITSGPQVGQHTRQCNGFWRRWPSYQNTRVSAVLLTDHLSPQNALETVPELWINPAATHRSVPMMPLWRRVRFGWVDGEERYYIARPHLSPAEFWGRSPLS
jgi:hypothetical protein